MADTLINRNRGGLDLFCARRNGGSPAPGGAAATIMVQHYRQRVPTTAAARFTEKEMIQLLSQTRYSDRVTMLPRLEMWTDCQTRFMDAEWLSTHPWSARVSSCALCAKNLENVKWNLRSSAT